MTTLTLPPRFLPLPRLRALFAALRPGLAAPASLGMGLAASGGGITWLLRDDFITDRAAGSVNGTAAEPGPGSRMVTDTLGNKVSISSGKLYMGSQSSWSSPSLVYTPSSAYTAGRMVFIHVMTPSQNEASFVMDYAAWDYGFLWSGLRTWGPITSIGGNPANNAWQTYALIGRAAGMFWLVKSSDGNWQLLWHRTSPTPTKIQPCFANASNSAMQINYIRVPVNLWLPAPLVSHGFGSAITPSDGLGHAEGIAGGIGSGGGGATFSNVGSTWSISSGKAINTPVLGTNLVVNPDFELDSNWRSGSTPLVNERSTEVVHSGNYSRKLSADSNGDAFVQEIPTTIGYYLFGIWAFLQSGTSINLQDYNMGGFNVTNTTVGSWQKLECVFRSGNESSRTVALRSFNSSPVTAFGDDAFAYKFALEQLLALTSVSCTDVLISVSVSLLKQNHFSGIALNWDSTTNPANGVIVRIDKAACAVEKCVNGTWTGLYYAEYTYSAGARLVVQKNGTSYRVYYNNALITTQTISDASIVNNTLHGLFSTDPGNTLDDLTIYATGTGGEYAYLDRFTQ